MNQEIAINQLTFGITLAALLVFGIAYAMLVRHMSNKKVSGQTAYMVVGGVAVALIASIPTFGVTAVVIFFCYFSACGLPMVIEYDLRVHNERRRDEEAAAALAKEAIKDDEPA